MTAAPGSERDNRLMWDGSEGHYEVWYATLNHRASGTGFWIRYVLEVPTRDGQGGGGREPYSELWFARFDAEDPARGFGIHHRYPVASLRPEHDPLRVTLGDAELTHRGMRGAVEGGGHAARWDLRWKPAERTHLHLPSMIYKMGSVDTRLLSPNLGVLIDGTVTADGTTYELSGEPGGQTHVWGRKHAYQWAWAHCNGFEGRGADVERGAVFEAVTAQLKRGSVILPKLTTFALYLDGEELGFRNLWTLPLARSDYSSTHYRLHGISPEARVDARFACRVEDMILAEYLDPDGDPAFCHNTCVADAEIKVQRRSPFGGRFRDAGTLTARRTAHFEWGGRAGDVVRVKRTHDRV